MQRLLALFFKVDLSFRNKNIAICNVYIAYIYIRIISIGFNRMILNNIHVEICKLSLGGFGADRGANVQNSLHKCLE